LALLLRLAVLFFVLSAASRLANAILRKPYFYYFSTVNHNFFSRNLPQFTDKRGIRYAAVRHFFLA
jgi:hypothetical protein